MNYAIKFKRLWIAFLLMGPVLCSCSDDEQSPCDGKPVIASVSSTLDRETPISEGNLSDWVIIQGTNLCGANKILFNDVEVVLNDAYITANEITLSIPRKVPTTITNKIVVESGHGAAEFDYTLSIPQLQIFGMDNEYISPGAVTSILGKNFDLYGIDAASGELYFGSQKVAIIRSSLDSVVFRVPDNATAGDKLKVIDGNNIEHIVPGQYKDDRGLLYSFDPYQGWNGQLKRVSGPTPTPVAGVYAKFEGTYAAWAWDETFHALGNFKFADLHVSGSLDNYVLRFEINVLSPWTNDPLKIQFQQANQFDATYEWAPYGATSFKTQGWKTVTIPMSFVKKDGATVTINDALANEVTFNRSFIHGGQQINLNFAIDNVRIVPKN